MQPRDNRVYKLSDVSNLDEREDPFLKKFFMIEEVARNKRMSKALNLLNKSIKCDTDDEDTDKDSTDRLIGGSGVKAKTLEEKILAGYYKS